MDTVAASDVIASSCAGPCCVVLVASCPGRRRAPRLDEFIVKGVPGAEPAMHRRRVDASRHSGLNAA